MVTMGTFWCLLKGMVHPIYGPVSQAQMKPSAGLKSILSGDLLKVFYGPALGLICVWGNGPYMFG